MRRLMELKVLSENLSSRLCESHEVIHNFMPISGLNMAHNHIVYAYEVASYYRSVLPMPSRGSLEDFMRDEPESTERINVMLNSCYISILSSLESCARKAIQTAVHLYGHVGNTIHLNNIMQRSRKLGWISDSDELMWLNLVKIRNYMVHNNGEGQRNEWFALPSGLIWETRIGLQSQVTLRHVPESLKWILLAYANWCDEFMKRWNAAFDYSPKWNKPYSYHLSATRVIPQMGGDTWAGYGAWSWREQPPNR
jgi:hypothetical protein